MCCNPVDSGGVLFYYAVRLSGIRFLVTLMALNSKWRNHNVLELCIRQLIHHSYNMR